MKDCKTCPKCNRNEVYFLQDLCSNCEELAVLKLKEFVECELTGTELRFLETIGMINLMKGLRYQLESVLKGDCNDKEKR